MKTGFLLPALIFSFLVFVSCNKPKEPPVSGSTETEAGAKVTFIELGSVNCIPCRQMQPVMKSIENKYGGQIKVVFYDVWKDRRPAQQYGIRLIPTQVFLDENGKEILRHEGFFPEEEIDRFLQTHGLKLND